MSVDRFMETLEHPRKREIEEIRQLLLSLDGGITEQVKWNAPSFCVAGDDRITLRLQPKNILQVIFHRGAKAKSTEGFDFKDEAGLARWITPDRGMVEFKDQADLDARKGAFRHMAQAWVDATR